MRVMEADDNAVELVMAGALVAAAADCTDNDETDKDVEEDEVSVGSVELLVCRDESMAGGTRGRWVEFTDPAVEDAARDRAIMQKKINFFFK